MIVSSDTFLSLQVCWSLSCDYRVPPAVIRRILIVSYLCRGVSL